MSPSAIAVRKKNHCLVYVHEISSVAMNNIMYYSTIELIQTFWINDDQLYQADFWFSECIQFEWRVAQFPFNALLISLDRGFRLKAEGQVYLASI